MTAVPAVAAPAVLLAAVVFRHERSVVGIGATIFSVLLLGLGVHASWPQLGGGLLVLATIEPARP